MKNIIPFIFCCIFIVSCRNDPKKENKKETEPQQEVIQKVYKDTEVEEALYSGFFIKNNKGFDISIHEGNIYLLKSNPNELEKNNNFFIHVYPEKGEVVGMDFPASKYLMNEELSSNYDNTLVYKRELPKVEGHFEINLGQFNNNGRNWETYIISKVLNETEHKYKNEYVKNTKTNRYLNEFENAFDQGYFMKHIEGYDMLLDMHALYYIKQNGNGSDLEDMFFLHVKYDNKDKVYGFDFNPNSYQITNLLGEKFKNFIVLKRELPEHGKVTEISTGQFNKDIRSWSYVYEIERLYDDMRFIYDGQYGDAMK